MRGPMVMPGYRNQPDKTREALDDEGWLHTGDVGEFDEDGYLKIVDRKKELIINAAGKNMSPANIEAKVKASSPLIGQAIAIGDGRPYNVALITLDPDVAPAFIEQNGREAVAGRGRAGGARRRTSSSPAWRDQGFRCSTTEWQPGGDELTPTMKLKRKPIHEKYAARDRGAVLRLRPGTSLTWARYGCSGQEGGLPLSLGEVASKRQIDVGGVKIGGGAPVAVQSMTKTETADFDATMRQIHAIADAGGDLVRCAVPRDDDVRALARIVQGVADPGDRRHPLQPHARAQGDRRRRPLHPHQPRQHRRLREDRRGRREGARGRGADADRGQLGLAAEAPARAGAREPGRGARGRRRSSTSS